MPSSVIQSNTLVMNKYLWMGRQLRNFNDAGSIINWANAMNMVKGLLLKSNDVSSLPAHPAPTSRTPIPSSHSPPQLHRSTDNKNICSPMTSRIVPSLFDQSRLQQQFVFNQRKSLLIRLLQYVAPSYQASPNP